MLTGNESFPNDPPIIVCNIVTYLRLSIANRLCFIEFKSSSAIHACGLLPLRFAYLFLDVQRCVGRTAPPIRDFYFHFARVLLSTETRRTLSASPDDFSPNTFIFAVGQGEAIGTCRDGFVGYSQITISCHCVSNCPRRTLLLRWNRYGFFA